MATQLTWGGIGLRFLAALILVFLTYNPSGTSYFHWVTENLSDWNAVKVFAGVVLAIGWVIYLRATMNSLGGVGLVLAAAFFGALVWLIISWGWLPTDSAKVVASLILVIISCILGVGISWSHIRRRLTGQYDTDEIEG